MYSLNEWIRPSSLEDAMALLERSRANTIIGGGCFLALQKRRFSAGIDLSRLIPSGIAERTNEVVLGAYTTLRQMETSEILSRRFGTVFSGCLGQIMGVQLRNQATIGGTVAARFGFSDVLPLLLALDARVSLYRGGVLAMEDFLALPKRRDILLEVRLPATGQKAACRSLRGAPNDFPILSVAVARNDRKWRVAVGARPGGAAAAIRCMKALDAGADAYAASILASEELNFGTNALGSADYRRAMCAVLIERCIGQITEETHD